MFASFSHLFLSCQYLFMLRQYRDSRVSHILLSGTSPGVRPYMACTPLQDKKNHALFTGITSIHISSGCHKFYYLAPFTVFDSFAHPFLPCQCLFTFCVVLRINLRTVSHDQNAK
jgi:hypothetical protein